MEVEERLCYGPFSFLFVHGFCFVFCFIFPLIFLSYSTVMFVFSSGEMERTLFEHTCVYIKRYGYVSSFTERYGEKNSVCRTAISKVKKFKCSQIIVS